MTKTPTRTPRWILGLSLSLLSAIAGPHVGATAAVKPGDIIVGNNVTNTIIAIDPASGAQVLVSQNGRLCTPESLAIDSGGQIVVASACENAVLRVDPATGTQTPISENGSLSYPAGLAIDGNGLVVVANYTGDSIVRIDPSNGSQTVVSSGGALDHPTDVAVAADGGIFVSSQIASTIVRIDPSTGVQTTVSAGGLLANPAAILFDGSGQLLVGNAGADNILRINPATGSQSVVSANGTFGYPSGIALDASGNLIVANYLANTIVRVTPATGVQTPVSEGGYLNYPTRLAIFHEAASPATTLTFDNVPNDQLVGYGGFNFEGWGMQSDADYMGSGGGNSYGSPSGEYAIGAGGGALGLWRSIEDPPGSCCIKQPFDFLGAYFSTFTLNDAPYQNSAVVIRIEGFRQGVLVRSIDYHPSVGYTWFDANFMNIDELRMQPFNSGFGFSARFLMDDFRFVAPSRGSPNVAPTASAGANQTIRLGTTVHLDGSGSFDDNTPTNQLGYSWSIAAAPSGSSAALAGAATRTPSFVPDLPGSYVIQLVVTDEEGVSSAPSQVTVADNPPPTANAGADRLVIVGSMVQLTGSGADPNGETLTYSWTLVGAPTGSGAAVNSPESATPTFVPDVAGVYTAQLTTSDPFGPGSPDAVQITAATPSGYAEVQVHAASGEVLGLPPASLTNSGNQNALTQFLGQAALALDSGQLIEAQHKLEQAILRTDGCALRGRPDASGPGRDWITSCAEQQRVYPLLLAALAAVTP
jgi:sugar lactone lactonase YvrE